MIVVVMGVSGSGKTVLGEALARRLGCEFVDGDDHHPPQNVAKMKSGVPLTDADRAPWLARLNAMLRERDKAVLACSALKQAYRDALAGGVMRCTFVHLSGGIELIRGRLHERQHRYMPASLLESQFATLEPPEHAIVIDVAQPPERCLEAMLEALQKRPSAA